MIDSSICVNIVLVGVVGSVFLNVTLNPVRELSHGHYCNKVYSLYVRIVCIVVMSILVLNSLNTSKLITVRKMIRKIEGEALKSYRTVCIAFLSAKVMLMILRAYAEFEIGPQIFLFTDRLPLLCVYTLSYRFIKSLCIVRGINRALLDKMRDEWGRKKDCCWSMDANCKNLRSYLVRASEIREMHQAVIDVFGLEFFLVQMVIVCGLAIHGIFLVHFTLKDEPSLCLSVFLCASLLECSVLAYFFADIGQSMANAAKDVIDEISRFPIAFYERHSFDGKTSKELSRTAEVAESLDVKYIILLCVKEPWYQNAWTFYGLTMDSFFSTMTATAAFVFVCVQFNSNYSIYELSIL